MMSWDKQPFSPPYVLRNIEERYRQDIRFRFTDLSEPVRCRDSRFVINQTLHWRPFSSMNAGLRLKTCNLDTSYCRNKDIPFIRCRFGAEHLTRRWYVESDGGLLCYFTVSNIECVPLASAALVMAASSVDCKFQMKFDFTGFKRGPSWLQCRGPCTISQRPHSPTD